LLASARIPFTVRPAEIDESLQPGEKPREYVLRVAEEKARAVNAGESEVVLAADTTVVVDEEILVKPVDGADAARMLARLAGKRHDVLTGLCLIYDTRIALDVDTTAVWFSEMTPREIEDYIASGEPMDKAGGYAIQGIASRWIERIDGSYANVVGLPIAMVCRHLRRFGISL
jgi:septum formation protein